MFMEVIMKREQFGSRLGFILVSAGCAIGLGNVWKFPYMAGKYGGAAFILVYLLFLVILGLPIIVCEFSVGRASQKSIATSYNALEPPRTKWHYARWAAIAGNYLLVMFYSMVGGWMLYYCFRMAKGEFTGVTASEVSEKYAGMLSSVPTLSFWTVLVILLSFGICSIGLQKGVEKIMKVTMLCLLAIMVILTIRSVTLSGSSEGLRFFLVPDFNRMVENGIGNVIFGAMSQAFFTLSIGMGGMGLPGDLSSQSRFVRVAFTKQNSKSDDSENASVSQFFHILGSVDQQRGLCEVTEGKYEITLYTSCCNCDKGIYYYTTYDNSQITAVDMNRENLDEKLLIRYPVITEGKICWQN